MTEVLQPLNERVAEIVTKNADLLEAAAMEPLLLQLVAHVSAYRVIIKRCGLPLLPLTLAEMQATLTAADPPLLVL
jgi:hypothetical protein